MILFIIPSFDDPRDRIPTRGAGASSERGDAHSRRCPETPDIRSRLSSWMCAALLCAAAIVLSACSGEESAAGSPFEPVRPGVLTVATAFLPAPGFWQGRTARAGGFEAGLAKALAKQ